MHALESHSIKSCSLLRIGRLERENEELKEVLKTIENELRQAQINCPAVCLRRELKETRRSMDTEVRRLEKQVRTLFTARVLHAVLILLPQLEKCKSEVKIESDIRAAAERETVRIKQGTCLSLTHSLACSLTHSHSLIHTLTPLDFAQSTVENCKCYPSYTHSRVTVQDFMCSFKAAISSCSLRCTLVKPFHLPLLCIESKDALRYLLPQCVHLCERKLTDSHWSKQ